MLFNHSHYNFLYIFSTVLQVDAAKVSELGTSMVKKTILGMYIRAILVTTNCNQAPSIGKRTTYQQIGKRPSGIQLEDGGLD